MREILILAIHLLVTVAKLLRPGGVRAVAAESLLLKHQLLISNRSRQRAPNLTSVDRFVLGSATLFVRPHRLPKLGALIKPTTLLKFHRDLVQRKYRRLFSSSPSLRRKPGPKGPSPELIAAIIALKGRNPHFGCVRIAHAKDSLWSVDLFRCESILNMSAPAAALSGTVRAPDRRLTTNSPPTGPAGSPRRPSPQVASLPGSQIAGPASRSGALEWHSFR